MLMSFAQADVAFGDAYAIVFSFASVTLLGNDQIFRPSASFCAYVALKVGRACIVMSMLVLLNAIYD